MRRKKTEGELAICRSIFIVSLRDMLSSATNYYTKRCKKDATEWLETHEENYFSFNNVVSYLFDNEIDEEKLRAKLKIMLKNRKIKGTRNLIKILTEFRLEDEDE
jgi:predicted nucleic-acid-binding protein